VEERVAEGEVSSKLVLGRTVASDGEGLRRVRDLVELAARGSGAKASDRERDCVEIA